MNIATLSFQNWNMKVLPFTILVPGDRSVSSEYISLPHFYQYLHRHVEWQITWVEEGAGSLIAGTDMHNFQNGDIFVIGPNLPHLLKSNPVYFEGNDNLKVKACSLYFDTSGILNGLFTLPEMQRLFTFLQSQAQGFKIPRSASLEISNQLFKVHDAMGAERLLNFVTLLQTLVDLEDLLEPLCSSAMTAKISEREGQRLSDIINYILKHYQEDISLQDIANTACLTPQAFCRYFKQHTKQTFVNYLNELRIQNACRQLISDHSSSSVSAIAAACGFKTMTHFNRVFKVIMGQSPRAYIKKYKQISTVQQAFLRIIGILNFVFY